MTKYLSLFGESHDAWSALPRRAGSVLQQSLLSSQLYILLLFNIFVFSCSDFTLPRI